jgi:hypothetical protein
MGSSDRPPSGYDKKTMARDIYELAKKLGFDKVNVAGHDIGRDPLVWQGDRGAWQEDAVAGTVIDHDNVRKSRVVCSDFENSVAEGCATGADCLKDVVDLLDQLSLNRKRCA